MIDTHIKEKKQSLQERLSHLEKRVGNTPIIQLSGQDNLFAKVESYQLGNSIKMRPAMHIIKKAIQRGEIKENTTVIESTSGNFGIALAMICKHLGLPFIGVIDKNTPKQKDELLKLFGAKVVLIDELDETGGYLLNRLRYIDQFKIDNTGNCFHPNQYKNSDNPDSYYVGLGEEIANDFPKLDAVVIAVSTGGTVTGLSRKLKLKFPNITIVAVDVKGSLVFQDTPEKRNLSGLGASRKSDHVPHARIDEIEVLSEEDIILGCKELLDRELIFAGASSGAAYMAAKNYQQKNPEHTVLFICPDNGFSYIESVYHK